MDVRCTLCNEPIAGSAVTTHEPERICGDCRALAPDERKALRDRAMVRMIRDGGD